MICEQCKENNRKSIIREHGAHRTSMTTLAGIDNFYDEEGEFHNHDPNVEITHYRCSNGHTWSVRRKFKCQNCDYGREE